MALSMLITNQTPNAQINISNCKCKPSSTVCAGQACLLQSVRHRVTQDAYYNGEKVHEMAI